MEEHMAEPEREPSDPGGDFNDSAGNNTSGRIRGLALVKASERHHSRITLSHLLLALIEDSPVLVDAVLSPKLQAATLRRVLDTDFGTMTQIEAPEGARIVVDSMPVEAISVATTTTAARYRSDWLFGLELLHAMLAANARADKPRRSLALDYIEMALADGSTDASARVRESIDRLAYALDEKRPPKTPPASAATYDPEL
jgi:hypothetical protein